MKHPTAGLKHMKRRVGLLACCATAFVANAAHAETYYVATDGDNDDPGTEVKPWRTIAYAVETMVAGDTTYVRGGLYNEDEILFDRPGTSTSPIRLLGYPSESPIIDFTGQTPYHRILVQHADGYNRAMGWITIEGFEIRNGYDGIKFHNLHDGMIRRNWIHGNRNQGILGNGTRVLVDSNVINHNGAFVAYPNSNLEHGIYMNGAAITITNNLIYDNLAYGITLNGSASSVYNPAKHAGPEFAASHDWIIANNTFAYNFNRSGIVVWGSTCLNARIENNIFYENGVSLANSSPNALDCVGCGASTGIVIRNNHSFASGSGAQKFMFGPFHPGTVVSDNIVNVSAPAFVNAPANLPMSPNFALTEGSSAIDAGVTLSEVIADIEGVKRPQGAGYDIGAYEWCADGDCGPGGPSTGSGPGSGSTSTSGPSTTSGPGSGPGSGSGSTSSCCDGSGGMHGGAGGGHALEDGGPMSGSCSVGSATPVRHPGLFSMAAVLAWLGFRRRKQQVRL